MNDGKLLKDKDVKQFLLNMIGEEGLDVVKSVVGRECTDEVIAEETGLKLNVVRKSLYKLYDYRLASYLRTKDKEIGWYIYTWKLDLSKISDILKERKRSMLEELTNRLEFETTNVFFSCGRDNTKVPFSVASENDFKCPQCNEIMDYADNRSVVVHLEREIKRLKKEIRN
ncbi:MAG: transcription factor E [Candidatus Hydrothermarchaeaceae archaeon]